MDEHQTAARALIERMLAVSGLDLTGLARKAGIAPSTLTRFMNSPVKHTVSAKTLQKLSEASGLPISLGGTPDDPDLAKLVASYRRMSGPKKQALLQIAAELASPDPTTESQQPARHRGLPPPRTGVRLRGIGSGR